MALKLEDIDEGFFERLVTMMRRLGIRRMHWHSLGIEIELGRRPRR